MYGGVHQRIEQGYASDICISIFHEHGNLKRHRHKR